MSPEDIDNIAQILRSMPKPKVDVPAFLERVEHIPVGTVVDHVPTFTDEHFSFICYAPDGLEPRQSIGQMLQPALTPVWCMVPWRAWGDSHEPHAGMLREQGLDVVAGVMCHPDVFEHLKNMRNAQQIERSLESTHESQPKRKL